ncbi:ATP-dependent DNA helicase PIF1 [Cercospora beticola]|uniref:ATP-dependent DNA helicase PIF1 n=1 Tax=Cercospora beticola TaxID=122368 RepID=A0A2G5I4W0_CERBT|nr:ATP-dependent DNA helicase PIF1 [Cercospora beticola]PIA99844.1 ATP-dependent DNA helicase PIF1 [Cercospora beticola]
MFDASPADNFLGVLLCATTAFVLHWMITGRVAGGRTRLPAAALAIPPTPPRARRAHVPFASTSSAHSRPLNTFPTRRENNNMLRKAHNEYERKTGLAQISQASFSSQSSSQKQSTNPGYKNPLKPSSASSLNGLRGSRSPSRAGIKRTSSGLAKSFDGTFDEDAGSRYQPVVIGGQPGKTVIPQALFDENEFDDDIDLDVEEPVARKTTTNIVSYPDLSAHLPKTTGQRSFHTTSTKPATIDAAAGREDFEFTNFDSGSKYNARTDQAPNSSAPLPWSSSPLEHFQPTGRPQKSLQSFAFDGFTGTDASRQPATSPQPKPAKRRTLPWLEGKSQEAEPTHTVSGNSHRSRPVTATPAPSKDRKDKSAYPWNTTASAVKEQQKKKREETRKTSGKVIEGTEESVKAATTKQKRPAKVFLSDEQQHVLELVIEKKKSVFFTGSAGTGKSVLMREIIASLRRKYQREPDRIAVTASTGLAACNVGGVTLHSFAGIGLGKEEVPELVRKIKKNQKAKHRWMRTKVLVLDEVSMVDGELFDKLESIARQIRNNARPFGGIQLVITGDFFQLPPVPEGGRVAKFAFDASTWPTTIEHTIGLHHVFRQKDPVFAGMLNEMREGRLTQSSIEAFKRLSRPLNYEDTLEATELFPTRQEVDKANNQRLAQLQGDLFQFPARDGGSIQDKTQRDRLLANCLAPEAITLKKGAQVMLIKNIDETLVNGSLGRVIGFMDERQFDSYNNNEAAFLQSPGGTVQSNAGDSAPMDVRQMMQGVTTSRKWPLVRFAIADGTWRDLLCEPETWKIELPNGEVQASRAQIPLILAWALSIHKAQGQTLDRVKVDLGRVFEKGQAYVALSRATKMDGLCVLRFDARKVQAHDKVRAFYSKLARVELQEKNKERMSAIDKSGVTKAKDYESNFVDGDFDDSNINWDEY